MYSNYVQHSNRFRRALRKHNTFIDHNTILKNREKFIEDLNNPENRKTPKPGYTPFNMDNKFGMENAIIKSNKYKDIVPRYGTPNTMVNRQLSPKS